MPPYRKDTWGQESQDKRARLCCCHDSSLTPGLPAIRSGQESPLKGRQEVGERAEGERAVGERGEGERAEG